MAYAPIRTSGGMTPAATQQVKKPTSPMAPQQRGIPAKPTPPKPMPQFGRPVTGAPQPTVTYAGGRTAPMSQSAQQRVAAFNAIGGANQAGQQPAAYSMSPAERLAKFNAMGGGMPAAPPPFDPNSSPADHPEGIVGWMRDRQAAQQAPQVQAPFDPNSSPADHPEGMMGWIRDRNAARAAAQQPYSMGMGGFNNQATVTMDPMLKIRMLMRQKQMQAQQPQL